MRDVEADVPGMPRPAFPLVLPKPFGFEDAVRRGRTLRRNRTLTAGASLMMALVAVLGTTVISREAGTQQIGSTNQQDPGGEDQVPYVPGDSDLPSAAPSAPTASAPAGDGSGPRAAAPGTGGVVRQHESVPGGVAAPAPKPPVTTSARSKPPMSNGLMEQADPCVMAVNSQDGWCTSALYQGGGWLEFRLCRELSDDPGANRSLTYPSAQEADFRIVDSRGNAVWQWSTGQRFGRPRSAPILLDPGQCYHWWLTWPFDDERGTRVPAGAYTLEGWSLADGFTGRAPATQGFSLP